jgi:hypothetical protein
MTRMTLTEARPVILTEAIDNASGLFELQIITPGAGASAAYPAEVLEAAAAAKVFNAGCHLFLDHPTATEEAERPVRSVRDLAGSLVEDARWNGSALVAKAKVYSTYRPLLAEVAPDIGMSIRATATVEEGEFEGQRMPIVAELHEALSIDFVTRAGRGGAVLAVIESARRRLEEAVSDTAWSEFSASDYDAAQWRRACLIDTGEGDEDSKARYKLPVREPDGAVNRNGCHAAASVLAGGRGGVSVGADLKRAAAKKLVGLYRNQLDEDPPESLLKAAGMATSESEATAGGANLAGGPAASTVTVAANGQPTTGTTTITFNPPLTVEARRASARQLLWEVSANDVERALQDAVSATYSVGEGTEGTFAWLRDYDPDQKLAYFEISVGGKTITYQQPYTAGEDDTFTLTGERTHV